MGQRGMNALAHRAYVRIAGVEWRLSRKYLVNRRPCAERLRQTVLCHARYRWNSQRMVKSRAGKDKRKETGQAVKL